MNEALITHQQLAAIHARVLERTERQSLRQSSVNLHGQQQSVFRGHGLELFDTRAYQPGDDIRHLDWRATARSGKPMSKVFHEERQRSVFLVMDRSAAMGFATRGNLKGTIAVEAAAIMAFATLADHEPVGGLATGRTTRLFPASRSLDAALTMLGAFAAPLSLDDRCGFEQADLMDTLYHSVPKGCIICLLSDIDGLTALNTPALARLADYREVIAFQAIDPAEQTLADHGRMRVVAPTGGDSIVIDTADENLRQRYETAMQQKQQTLQNIFSSLGIPLHRLDTRCDVFAELRGLW